MKQREQIKSHRTHARIASAISIDKKDKHIDKKKKKSAEFQNKPNSNRSNPTKKPLEIIIRINNIDQPAKSLIEGGRKDGIRQSIDFESSGILPGGCGGTPRPGRVGFQRGFPEPWPTRSERVAVGLSYSSKF